MTNLHQVFHKRHWLCLLNDPRMQRCALNRKEESIRKGKLSIRTKLSKTCMKKHVKLSNNSVIQNPTKKQTNLNHADIGCEAGPGLADHL